MKEEPGAVALVTTMLSLLLVVLATAVIAGVAERLTTGSRLQGAADAAALAVLAGSVLVGGDGAPAVQAGAAVARANGAVLVEVDVAGWPLGVVVLVVAPDQPTTAGGPGVDGPGAGGMPGMAGPEHGRRAAARLVPG